MRKRIHLVDIHYKYHYWQNKGKGNMVLSKKPKTGHFKTLSVWTNIEEVIEGTITHAKICSHIGKSKEELEVTVESIQILESYSNSNDIY